MNSPNHFVFQERLRQALRRRGKSQRWLGEQLDNTHRTTISKWLKPRGDSFPSGLQLFLIGDLLDVGARWLVGMRDEPSRGLFPTARQSEMLSLFEELGEDGQELTLSMMRDLKMAMQQVKG